MTNITTSADMCLYIKRQLGFPVINVEIATSQLKDIIDDSADIMTRYLYGEASYRTYLTFSVTSGIDEYSLSGNNVLDVFDFEFNSGTNGINSLFTPIHTLLYSDWVVHGRYPGRGSSNLALTEYQISMDYLDQVKRAFGEEYLCDYWPQQQVLKITPTPSQSLNGIIFVYKKEETVKLYSHILMRQLCVAKSKILWGSLLEKFSMPLPGGGEINGTEVKSDGKEELEDVMKRIESEGEPIGFLVG